MVRTVEGQEVPGKALALLADGEQPVFAARPSYATPRAGEHWNATTLLLTDRRLLITKDRLLGKAKADLSIEWSDVRSVTGALWKGGGPQIQLLVDNARTPQPLELIVQPQYAVDVESAIRRGYLT